MQHRSPRHATDAPADPQSERKRAWTFDEIAEELRVLRERAGKPSYAEIVRLIGQDRLAAGTPHVAAYPARTTVYDCFRSGRSRLNVQLVGEIVRVLTRDADVAEQWRSRCASARPSVAESEVREADERAAEASWRPSAGFSATVMVAGVALNLALIWVFAGPPLGWLRLPVFLDMIGTAICAIALGPWYGAAVGVLTNVGETAVLGTSSIPFAVVQVVGALLWGYGIRTWRFGNSLHRYFLLHLVVALACTATATPILVLLFPGDGGHSSQITLINSIHQTVDSFVASVFSGNLFYSVVDKLIAGFAALPVLGHLHARHPIPGLGFLPPADS